MGRPVEQHISTIHAELAKVDEHFNEFPVFSRNTKQNLDGIKFVDGEGKAVTGHVQDPRTGYVYQMGGGRWFNVCTAPEAFRDKERDDD